jgi:hypothetical protein
MGLALVFDVAPPTKLCFLTVRPRTFLVTGRG